MDTTTSVVIVIIVLLVIAAVAAAAYFVSRRQTAARAEADRNKAAELRDEARHTKLAASEREAESARAAADAQRAQLESERLARVSEETRAEAARVRDESAEKLRRADEVDPDVVVADADAGNTRTVTGDGVVSDTVVSENPPEVVAADAMPVTDTVDETRLEETTDPDMRDAIVDDQDEVIVEPDETRTRRH